MWRKNLFLSALKKHNLTNSQLWETQRGHAGGIYAHWQTALAYAKWLSPELHLEEKQFLLPGSRPGTLAYTNLGMGFAVDEQLEKAGFPAWSRRMALSPPTMAGVDPVTGYFNLAGQKWLVDSPCGGYICIPR